MRSGFPGSGIDRAHAHGLSLDGDRRQRFRRVRCGQRGSPCRGEAGAQLHRIYKVVGRDRPRLGQPGLELVGTAAYTDDRRTGQPIHGELHRIRRAGQRSAARETHLDDRFLVWRGRIRGRVTSCPASRRPPSRRTRTSDVIHQMRKMATPIMAAMRERRIDTGRRR